VPAVDGLRRVNHYGRPANGADKDIVVYSFNGHESGAAEQLGRQIRWLGARLGGVEEKAAALRRETDEHQGEKRSQ
jgi:hypothetical protein